MLELAIQQIGDAASKASAEDASGAGKEGASAGVLKVFIHSFIHSLHAFQSADQVRCSRHSVAALQPALSWGLLHHVNGSPAHCRPSLT